MGCGNKSFLAIVHDMIGSSFERIFFSKVKSVTNKRMSDYDYIRRKILRNGVNKKLLGVECCEECHMNDEEPLKYFLLCYFIRHDIPKGER